MKPTYEELERVVAMQAEALKESFDFPKDFFDREDNEIVQITVLGRHLKLVRNAISASAESVAAWEAEKLEPVLWYEADQNASNENVRDVIGSMMYSTRINHVKPTTNNPVWPLYAAPIPSADVAELQRKYADLKVRCGELCEESLTLTRKLAEQQALFSKLTLMVWPKGNKEFLGEAGFEELTKLIEEARKQEREECAKICDKLWNAGITTNITKQQIEAGADHCAAAIRAKGN